MLNLKLIEERMNKLEKDEIYWIRTSKDRFKKYIYLGEVENNNFLLMFEAYDNRKKKGIYKETFLKQDFLTGRERILSKQEYRKEKSKIIWEGIDKVLNKHERRK